MLNKLRRKFIAIAMCSIVLVLGCIIGIINVMNYYNINNSADNLLNIIIDNDGVFPRDIDNNNFPDMKRGGPKNISPEAPFETRYFTVLLNETGETLEINTGRIAAVSNDVAVSYSQDLFRSGKTEGFIGNYKYRAVSTLGGIMYVFLDCGEQLRTFYSFLFTSVTVSLIGVLLVLILVLIFSKIAVKPVAESYEKQKRFITDASHEIKTPLTIIDANTEVLDMQYGENEWIKSIRNQVKRLSKLTERLVYLSKMDEEKDILHMMDFCISDVVYEATQPYETMAKTLNKNFTINVEENLSYYGDETSIMQLVSLLLDNAMKYSNENGIISLDFKAVGKNKVLTVKNTVDEIQKGKLNMLFERFYRLDESRNSQTGGFGIGLSVAKAIVNAHKGKITAFSADGKSIEITVVL